MKEINLSNLKDNAVFKLSLSSKELFHSNFLDWLANCTETRTLFNEILHNVFGCKTLTYDPLLHLTLREYKNFDFCICERIIKDSEHKNGQEKYGRILFVLENKFKSIPKKKQLDEYASKAINYNDIIYNKRKESLESKVPYFTLLTLAETFRDKKAIEESHTSKWTIATYKDYALSLKNNSIKDPFTKSLIEKYTEFIIIFEEYVNSRLPEVTNDNKEWLEAFKSGIDPEIRLDDIWQKLVAEVLAEKIKQKLSSPNYHAIEVETGYSHSSASISIYVKLNEYFCGIQIQGNKYRKVLGIKADGKLAKKKGLSTDLEKQKSKDRSVDSIYAENIILKEYPQLAGKDSIFSYDPKATKRQFCKFGAGFVYQRTSLSGSIAHVIEVVVSDIEKIIMLTQS